MEGVRHMNQYYSDRNQRNETHPVAAGILGAALGAVVGIAVSSILSDPEKRKQVGRHMQDLQKWGNATIRDLKDRTTQVEETMREEADILATGAERMKGDIQDTSEKMQTKAK